MMFLIGGEETHRTKKEEERREERGERREERGERREEERGEKITSHSPE